MSRELTQVEYNYLWNGLHKNPSEFAAFLTDYNLKVSKRKQINFFHGHRGRIEVCIVWRESLPGHLQDELDHYEATLPVPFVGGCKVVPITAGLRSAS